mgnify:CR=1 FL=1
MSIKSGVHSGPPAQEEFTAEEAAVLSRYVSNVDKPVFALMNLPEVVKGALFARYSRSNKSLRRLMLEEFRDDLPQSSNISSVSDRADSLYDKVFGEYGDDSIAQLGGVHLACEGVSNILTKVLERGRLISCLEQSTRYIAYDDKISDTWRCYSPEGYPSVLKAEFSDYVDQAFGTYSSLLAPMIAFYADRNPRPVGASAAAHSRAVRAKALDALRGLLPAATRSNLGLYGSGQAYEALLIRMRASALPEVREYSDMILHELRKVIPSFMTRVDRADRGVAWSAYLENNKLQTELATRRALSASVRDADQQVEVQLVDFDPDGEMKVIAAAMYTSSGLSDESLLQATRAMSNDLRADVLNSYVGERGNRRHKPGRAFERTRYRFDVLTDYGAFRDLQRHRILSLDWQPLGVERGYDTPADVVEAGFGPQWDEVMLTAASLFAKISDQVNPESAQYVVPMAYRIRFYMDMNAREAMHVLELRTAPQGHSSYRRVCQEMHRLIEDEAGHGLIAAAMSFVNHDSVNLERLESESAVEVSKSGE